MICDWRIIQTFFPLGLTVFVCVCVCVLFISASVDAWNAIDGASERGRGGTVYQTVFAPNKRQHRYLWLAQFTRAHERAVCVRDCVFLAPLIGYYIHNSVWISFLVFYSLCLFRLRCLNIWFRELLLLFATVVVIGVAVAAAAVDAAAVCCSNFAPNSNRSQ